MSSTTFRSGWMHKQKSITKKWKLQWFVLSADGILRYYDNQHTQSAEDAARMSAECLRISVDNNIVGINPPDNRGRACLLQLEFRNKTWNLCAETPDDATAWQFALEDARVIAGANMTASAPQAYRAAPAYSVTAPNVTTYGVPQQQMVVQGVPNQVVYVNPAGSTYSYQYPTPYTTQRVVHHANGNTTVYVSDNRLTYGSAYAPLFFW